MNWQPIVVDGSDDPLPVSLVPDSIPDLLAELFDMRPVWHRRAACRGKDPAIFFPGRGESTEPGRNICSTCPVSGECAAAGRHERFGIWAGTSERQRRQLRRRAA